MSTVEVDKGIKEPKYDHEVVSHVIGPSDPFDTTAAGSLLAYIYRMFIIVRNMDADEYRTHFANAASETALAKKSFNFNNLRSALQRGFITWSSFIKGMKVLNYVSLEIAIKAKRRKGDVDTVNLKVDLSSFNFDKEGQ